MIDNKYTLQLEHLNTSTIVKSETDEGYFAGNREELFKYRLYLKKAKHFYKKGDLAEAYQYYRMAKRVSVKIFWYEAEAHCLMAIGAIHTVWEKFDVAYKNYMQCLNIVIDKDLYNSLSLIYFRLSDFYGKTSRPKLCRTYSEKAINSIKIATILE